MQQEFAPLSRHPLAIHGGPAHMPAGPPAWPPADDAIRRALETAYVDGSWALYDGPQARRLEQLLREWLGLEFVSLVASGTYAVELALRGLGVTSGDEVLLAGYDFSGNFRGIEVTGARPVLVDIRPDSWCLDGEQIEEAISPRTRAVLVSHLHGCLAPMDAIRRQADQFGISIVEDACQVPGAMVAGRLAGGWGDVSVFSFGGSKLLTAGRGGAVATAREDVHQRMKIHSERGNLVAPLSELQAAVLPPQLARLAERNATRLKSVRRLLDRCRDLTMLSPAAAPPDGWLPAFYKLAWRITGPEGSVDRQRFLSAAQAEGIGIDAGFRGFARRGARRCRTVGSLPHARHAAEATVVLHHPVLLESRDVIDQLAEALRKVALALSAEQES